MHPHVNYYVLHRVFFILVCFMKQSVKNIDLMASTQVGPPLLNHITKYTIHFQSSFVTLPIKHYQLIIISTLVSFVHATNNTQVGPDVVVILEMNLLCFRCMPNMACTFAVYKRIHYPCHIVHMPVPMTTDHNVARSYRLELMIRRAI